MKKRTSMLQVTLASIGMAVAPEMVNAAVIIDYDDGIANGIHESSIRDGGFETDTPDGSNEVVSPTFWQSTGTGNLQIQSNLTSPDGGGQNAVMTYVKVYTQNTGYTITLGDQFDGSFAWRDAFNWTTGETVDMTLFYTDDNTIDGVQTSIFTYNTGNEVINNTWENEAFTSGSGVSDLGAIGKTLFVSFSSSDSNADSYARIDNVYLNVTSIPEPSSTALLGLGGTALLLRRRRK